ncbi:O-antigen ligase family protein [Puia dinghuensis]|uniref:O-antigen ligase-related domain-containing protein n=1 Tax=Puia dinghuensis TaxID=1792502 RepID=A0A8J2UGY7_9BACT|nr:O-antigen ligase family protein [Puia dinghuensis]GGB16621.1 hypothetical protein GCM10011511_45550 [Puia dinghuensis]
MDNNYAIRRKQRVSGRFSKFLAKTFLDEKLNNWFGYILLGLMAATLGYLMPRQPVLGGVVLAVVFGLCVALPCLASARIALYFIVFFNYFIYVVPRLLDVDAQVAKPGIGYDALLVLAMLGFVLRRDNLRQASAYLFRSQVMVWTLILFLMGLLEFFNPLAHSLFGWYTTFRLYLEAILLLFISFHVFSSWKRIDEFLLVLFWASFLCGLYGCIEQWHGLFPFEMVYIAKNKGASVFFAGQVRKFSTTSGPTAFGMDMAAMVVLYTIIGLNEKRKARKRLYLIGVIPMLLASTYSGTRTSNIMMVAGLGLYVLLRMDRKETRMLAIAAVALLLIMIRLPYYGSPTLNRFRTSFEGQHDESNLVRERNRHMIQPYILVHPIGGGLGTTNANGVTYNPGHYLAGFATDDNYLKTALEMGWIGLIISVILLFMVMRTGIREYFTAPSDRNKTVIAACLACIFTFVVGDIAQEGIGEITMVEFFYPCIAILLRANYVPEETPRLR